MAQTDSLVAKLIADYPNVQFTLSDDFYWSPSTNTIFMKQVVSQHDILTLLHEIAHAKLHHDGYSRDIDLVKCERDAWGLVKNELADRYGVDYDDSYAEDMLDSYRDWLHARSTCPSCTATGIQTKIGYRCVSCLKTWRVNEARRCGLRRYATT